MAIKVNFNGMTIQKPGIYGPPIAWTRRHNLLYVLAKLGIKSARSPRHPYENVDRDEEER